MEQSLIISQKDADYLRKNPPKTATYTDSKRGYGTPNWRDSRKTYVKLWKGEVSEYKIGGLQPEARQRQANKEKVGQFQTKSKQTLLTEQKKGDVPKTRGDWQTVLRNQASASRRDIRAGKLGTKLKNLITNLKGRPRGR